MSKQNKIVKIMNTKNPIQIVPDDIKSTETFQKLTHIQQRINLNRNSRMAIEQSVNFCLIHGLEFWLERTNSRRYHQDIVKEIYKSKFESC